MRPQIDVHLAVTFVKPLPEREDDPGRGTGATSQPPIQRPDDGIVLQSPPGTVPRLDFFVTVVTEGTPTSSSPSPARSPEPQSSKHDS